MFAASRNWVWIMEAYSEVRYLFAEIPRACCNQMARARTAGSKDCGNAIAAFSAPADISLALIVAT